MFTAKISDSLAELRNDLDVFERAVSEMIKDKEMGSFTATQKKLEEIHGEDNLHALSRTPIAIVGMASLFPESKDTQTYWDNILREVDCITEVPASRWNSSDYFDQNPRAVDKTYCKRGGFIPDIDFNPMEFGLPPNVLEATDISQLLALVIAREAMNDAGYGPGTEFNREKTGVVLGAVGRQLSGPLWGRLQYPIWERVLKSSGLSDEDSSKIIEKLKLAYPSWQENSFPGMLSNVISGRIANRFDFGGLNCTLDAACASSLAALKMALSELVERRADVMLTGGVDPDNSAFTYLCFSKTPALSPSQESRPFDAQSDGIMLGEGVGMVVLKRLEDAERDGDRIYAVIRGLGTSSDGRFKSIYAPRPEGQVKAIRRAYEDANIDPATVGLVEAHGTGTMAGDPAEFEGMKAVFSENNPRKQHIALGSVKSQIGHTKTAAGVASLIKASLALYHKVLPPTINVEKPSAKLGIEDSPFYLNTKLRPWIHRAGEPPRRAGVSSFGFGGTNFHVVLEEYQSEQSGSYRVNPVPQPILVAAATPQVLAEQCQTLLNSLQGALGEACYVDLVNGSRDRQVATHEARLGFVAESFEDACRKMKVAVNLLGQLQQETWEHPLGIYYRSSGLELQGKVVALFSGQGSQYLDMGQTLAVNFPPLRETLAHYDQILAADGLDPLSQVVYPRPVFDEAAAKAQKQQLRRTEYAQPAIAALSTGLYKLFQQAGFKPSFTAGHSFGELTALWAAGVLNEVDYAFLVKARGQAMAAPGGRDFDAGTMLAVKGDASRIQAIVEPLPGVEIANFNSGQQVVLAGATGAIAAAKAALEAQKFEPIPLPVSAAFHTPLVAHAQVPFSQAIDQVNLNAAQVPVFTNVTGQVYPAVMTEVKGLLQRHMVSQVQFKQEIENLYAAGGFCFVEFGPKNVLTNLVKEILADRPHLAIATNASRHKDSDLQMREAAMQLRVAGLPLANIDPYQLPLQPPVVVDEKAKRLMVKINGASFISEKTQAAFEAAVEMPFGQGERLAPVAIAEQRPAPMASNTAPSSISQVATANGFVGSGPTVSPPSLKTNALASNGHGSNGHGNGNGKGNGNGNGKGNGNGIDVYGNHGSNGNGSNGNGSNGANGHEGYSSNGKGSNGHVTPNQGPSKEFGNGQLSRSSLKSPAQEPNPVKPAHNSHSSPSSPSSGLISGGELEPILAQFNQHQSQLLHVHEQYLEVHREYTQAFCQLTQKHQTLGEQGSSELIASSERNLMAFHQHQQETLRVHEQYLNHQIAFANRLCELSQHPGSALTLPLSQTPQAEPTKRTEAQTTPVTEAPVAEAPIAEAPVIHASAVEATVPLNTPLEKLDSHGSLIEVVTPPTTPALDLAPQLLSVVSDKTGYPVEMLELDMDMEADLGIDSIKRVEILGALQDAFPELPQPNLEELAEIEMRTLGQVVDYMQSKMANPSSVTAIATTSSVPATAPVTATISPSPLPASAPTVSAPASTTALVQMQTKLLEVVSDKTGYPAEMLELDMDMEADLGIDSIKRVEILGSLQDAFPELPQPNLEELAEVEMRTLGQVADYMQSLMDGGSSRPAIAPSSPTLLATPSQPPVPTPVQPPSYAPTPAHHTTSVAAAISTATFAAPAPPATAVATLPRPTAAPAIAAAPQAVATLPPLAAPTTIDAGTLQAKLLEVVSDKTGYPAEMLELDMDMEADLGIDSIKRVEILGALQDAFPELPQPNLEELAEVEMRTLGQVADYMHRQLETDVAPAVAAIAPTEPVVPQVEPQVVPQAELVIATPEVLAPMNAPVDAPPVNAPVDASVMQTKLLEVVSDKTGYPAEMLELDMDMEADLGIDSIKRVEILGALQDIFPDLPQPNLEELAEVELRTLGQVADYMQSLRGGEKKNQLAPSAEPQIESGELSPSDAAQAADPLSQHALPLEPLPLPRHPAQLQYLPPADWLDFNLPPGHIGLLTDDGTETTTQLAQQLVNHGWKLVVLSFPTSLVAQRAQLPAGVQRIVLEQLGDQALGQQLAAIAANEGTPAAFIHLQPTGFMTADSGLDFPEAEATLIKQVFFLAKHLKASLNQSSSLGRSVFMTVARLDGSFGLAGQGGFSPIAAGLAGLTKTLNFEWRSVFCRAVDLNPALAPAQAVSCILAELHDPDGVLPEAAYGDRGRVTLVAA